MHSNVTRITLSNIDKICNSVVSLPNKDIFFEKPKTDAFCTSINDISSNKSTNTSTI